MLLAADVLLDTRDVTGTLPSMEAVLEVIEEVDGVGTETGGPLPPVVLSVVVDEVDIDDVEDAD